MATYSVIQAVAGTKNKASVYNENFTRMKNYVDTSISDLQTETQSTLSVYQDVNSLTSSGTLTLEKNKLYALVPTGDVAFTLPTIEGSDANKFWQIMVQVKLTNSFFSNSYSIDFGTEYFFDLQEPELPQVGQYNIYFEYDNIDNNWVCGAIIKGANL